jgi:hypothetical protein
MLALAYRLSQVNGIVCLNLPQNQFECLTSSGAVVPCSEPGVVSRTPRQFLFPPDISVGCPRCVSLSYWFAFANGEGAQQSKGIETLSRLLECVGSVA